MDQFGVQLALFNRDMELFASSHSWEERAHDSNPFNTWPNDGNPEEEMLEAIRASQMMYEQALNGCLEASAFRFSGLEASLRRIEVHFGAMLKTMQGEEVGEEETSNEMKDLMPYVLPTIFPSRLLQSNWSKYFLKLIRPLFQVRIYLPLFYVIKNTSVGDKYFQDLIAYKCIFETLEFG
ncbi:hypothetical protein QYF36_024742 [Acer negundo]|nr:hypothetical protein QYF36_024742 [Acer negundo]